ncbi:hypothetical protein M493_11475 [Geobacillus genomosp. 3]|uniref:Uncharacterized protein n=1 Tax=Geobacillus genomosp. 3 TaxID=1921421 RepID=S5ZPZ1_GEOG3|nr:hypothetical protein M493_11475 [Geobacillus genomosp. 3]
MVIHSVALENRIVLLVSGEQNKNPVVMAGATTTGLLDGPLF